MAFTPDLQPHTVYYLQSEAGVQPNSVILSTWCVK